MTTGGTVLSPAALWLFVVKYTSKAKDGTRVVFREPRETDAVQLMNLINSVIDEPMSGLLMNKRTSLKDERKWLKHRIEDIKQRRTVMLVAEVDGRIMGNCDIVRRSAKESHRAVLGIVLLKEIRGKGIGEAIMVRAIELARKRFTGIEQIDLQTFSYNKRAQIVYRKVGFVKTGFVPRAIKEGSEYYGEDVMVLYL